MIQATANIRYRFYEASTERERRPGPVGCRPCPDSAAPPDSGPRPAVRRRQSAPVAICHPITDPRRLWPPAGAAPARPRALWTETAACADRTRHGQTAAGAAPAKRLSLSVAPHGTESRSGVSRSGETHPVTEAEAARALIRQLFVFVYLMASLLSSRYSRVHSDFRGSWPLVCAPTLRRAISPSTDFGIMVYVYDNITLTKYPV